MIADSPRCAYAECAARPRVRTMTRSEPFAPLASLLSVGSPLTRNLLVAGETVRGARAVGALLFSDDEEQVDALFAGLRELVGGDEHRGGDALRVAGAAAVELVPHELGAMYGGTVSRCVESVTPRPLRDAQTLARPRVTSWRCTFQPRATSQLETKSTAPLSAPVEESIARSSAASATTSVIPAKLAGPETSENGPAGSRNNRHPERSEGSAVLNCRSLALLGMTLGPAGTVCTLSKHKPRCLVSDVFTLWPSSSRGARK